MFQAVKEVQAMVSDLGRFVEAAQVNGFSYEAMRSIIVASNHDEWKLELAIFEHLWMESLKV